MPLKISSIILEELFDNSITFQQFVNNYYCHFSRQGRSLYNVLLDIISRLSDAEVGVPETEFQTICNELFSHVTNDKQTESLMERFVLRFRATT